MFKSKFLRGLLAAFILVFFAAYNYAIWQKERLLASGQEMTLALAPVDPRSLMQGDYMILRFALADDVTNLLSAKADTSDQNRDYHYEDDPPHSGLLIVRKAMAEAQGPAIANLYAGPRLAGSDDKPGPDEHFLRYRAKAGGSINIAGNSFFFQEGTGAAYSAARYALLRVNAKGEAIITGLLDKNGVLLKPHAQPEPPDGPPDVPEDQE